jgi:hypothetical protein
MGDENSCRPVIESAEDARHVADAHEGSDPDGPRSQNDEFRCSSSITAKS